MIFALIDCHFLEPVNEWHWGDVGAEYWWLDPCHDENADWPSDRDLVGEDGPDKNLGEDGPVEYDLGEPPVDEIIGVEPGVTFWGMYGVIENWYPVNASYVSGYAENRVHTLT